MANSKIYLGSTNIGSLFQGSDDISIYLGDEKVYPLGEPTFQGKWLATYTGGTTSSAECDSSSAITDGEINLRNLVSVEIGDCVTSIDVRAFYNCYSLTSIEIPNSVTSINDFAFLYSNGFTSIVIPDSVTSIGIGAFYQCYGLTSITVNATTPPTLGFRAFDDTNDCPIYVPCESVEAYKSASGWSDYASRITCKLKFTAKYSGGEIYEKGCDSSSLITTSVTKPTGYQYTAMTEAIIGDCASTVAMNSFSGFTSLSSVTISDNVTSLANQVFKGCINLTEVKLPSEINKILPKTFENCTSLKNIDIPSGVTMIGGFENCTSLENITLPNALSEIYGEAFKGCTSLTSIDIPDSVTSIGDYAFSGCTSFTSVTIPSGVTSIGVGTFGNCYNLTSIDIPNSVRSIGQSAFNGCSGLTSCTIGSGVTTISSSAFNNCTSLTSITVNATTPPTLVSRAFDDSTCPIYVPSQSVNAYKSATNWSDYAARIQAIP